LAIVAAQRPQALRFGDSRLRYVIFPLARRLQSPASLELFKEKS